MEGSAAALVQERPWTPLLRYLDRQLPASQALSLCLVVVLSYLLYGRLGGTTPVGYELVAAAATVVLLFLQIRLVEDLEIDYNGSEMIGEIGRRSRPPRRERSTQVLLPDGRLVPRASTLVAGTVATTAALCALNAPLGIAPLAAALTATAALVLAGRLLRIERLPRIFGTVPFFELVPALSLAYVYFAWRAAADASPAPVDVVVVVGLFSMNWEFWKFSRGIGKYDVERVYGLGLQTTCWASLAVVAVSMAFQLALWSRADLSVASLVSWVGVAAVSAAAMVATPGGLRRHGTRGARPPHWVGLAFPQAVLAGLI